MSQTTRTWLGTIAAIIAMATGISGLVGAFYLLPYRVAAVEQRIGNLNTAREKDHELLTRIEERIISMQRTLDQQKAK